MMALESLTTSHAALLAGMHRVCFAEPWDEKAMHDLLVMPGSLGWLAATAAGPQGFILLRVAADEAEILTLLVLPPYRRRGIAATLLGEAIQAAKRQGAVKLFLEVSEHNLAAQATYTKHGFHQVGLRPRYYSGGANALLLRRNL